MMIVEDKRSTMMMKKNVKIQKKRVRKLRNSKVKILMITRDEN